MATLDQDSNYGTSERRTKLLTEISRERPRLLLPGELQKSGDQEDRDQVLGTNLENGLRTFDRHAIG